MFPNRQQAEALGVLRLPSSGGISSRSPGPVWMAHAHGVISQLIVTTFFLFFPPSPPSPPSSLDRHPGPGLTLHTNQPTARVSQAPLEGERSLRCGATILQQAWRSLLPV